jgi:bifunctional DNase/RNase
MIEMELLDVRVEPPHNVPVVLLREPGTGRILPIYIGASEATAIALAMQHHETPRPMTHDLFRNVLDELGVSLERVVVTELQDKTFYAELHLASSGKDKSVVVVSSRPSDAIALAVRVAAPIFAAEQVLEEAGVILDDSDDDNQDQVVEQFREFIEQVNPEDFV